VVAKHLKVLQEYSPEYGDAYEALNRLGERVLSRVPNTSPAPVAEGEKAKAQSTGGQG
jgi:hypothetical protein